jgi:coenzyme F420-reducing hydrogenase delta subunit
MASKLPVQLESVEISLTHVDEVADSLYKRLQEEEREQLIKLFIKKEAVKKIEESAKKAKTINKSVEEFTKEIEKRILNKIILLEVKQKVMSKQR